ncbi:RpnC/YadD family protein, partial [Bacteroides fragilis]
LYSEVKKVYSISILYFDIGRGTDYLYHGQNSFVGVHTGDLLEVSTKEKNAIVRKLPAEIFPEYFLIRVNEFNKVAVTPLEEWIEYLKTGVIHPDTKAPGLEEARRKLVYYNMNKAEQLAYDEHINAIMIQNDVLSTAAMEGRQEGRQEGLAEGRQEGLAEGRQEGLAEGRMEEKQANARRMKALNLPVETICQVTGLSAGEIESL